MILEQEVPTNWYDLQLAIVSHELRDAVGLRMGRL